MVQGVDQDQVQMEGTSKPSNLVQWGDVSLPLQVELFENLATTYGKRNQLPQEPIRHLLTRCVGFKRARDRLCLSSEEFAEICRHVQQRKKQEILEDAGVKDLQEAQLNMMLKYDHSIPLRFDPFTVHHALTERCWSHYKDEGYFTCKTEDTNTVTRYLLEHCIHPSMAGEWVLNTRYPRDPTAVGGSDRNSSILLQNTTAGTSHPSATLENEVLLSSAGIANFNPPEQKKLQAIAEPTTSTQITQRGGDMELSENAFGKEMPVSANGASSPPRPRLLIRLSLGNPSQSPEQSASLRERSFTPAFEVSQNGRAMLRSLEDRHDDSTQQPLHHPQTPSNRQISTPWTPARATFPRVASPKLPVQRQLVDSRQRGGFGDFESKLLDINSAVAGNTPYSTFQPHSLSSPIRRVGNTNTLSVTSSHAIESGPSQGGTSAEESDTPETRKRKRSLAAQVSPAYSPITPLADSMGEPAELSPVVLPSPPPPRLTGPHQGSMIAIHAPTSSTLVGTSSPRKSSQSSPGQQLTQSLADSLTTSQLSGYVDQASASPQALTSDLLREINALFASSQHRRGSQAETNIGDTNASAKNGSGPKPDSSEAEVSRPPVNIEADKTTRAVSTDAYPTRTPLSGTDTPKTRTKRAEAVEKWPNGLEYKHGPQTRTLKKWKEEGRISNEVFAASLPVYPRPAGNKPIDENTSANEPSQSINTATNKLPWWGSTKASEDSAQQGQQHDGAFRKVDPVKTAENPEQFGQIRGNNKTLYKHHSEPVVAPAGRLYASSTNTQAPTVKAGAGNERDGQIVSKTTEEGFRSPHPGSIVHVSAASSDSDQSSPASPIKSRRKHRKKNIAVQHVNPDDVSRSIGQVTPENKGTKMHKRQLSGQTDGSNEGDDVIEYARTKPEMASVIKQKQRPSPKKAKHDPPSTDMRRTRELSMSELTANMPQLPPPVKKPTKDGRRSSKGSEATQINGPELVYRRKASFHGNEAVRADGTPRNRTPATENELQRISMEPTKKLVKKDTQVVKNSSRRGKATKATILGNSGPVLSPQRATTPEPAPQASPESPSKSPFRGNQFRHADGSPRTKPPPVASPRSQRFNGNQWTNADGSPRLSNVGPAKKSNSGARTRKNSVPHTQNRKKTPGRTPSLGKSALATTPKKNASATKVASAKKTTSPKKKASATVPSTPVRVTQTSTATTPGSKSFQGNQYYHADGTPKIGYVAPDGKRAQKERANIRT